MVHPLSSAVVVLLAVVAYQYWITDHVEVSQYDNIQQWRLRGSYFRNPDGYLVFYVDETNPTSSTPETLLLVHGYPTCSFDWLKVWPQLATRFRRIIAYDMLGYGLSDKPKNFNYTIIGHAETAFSLLSTLQVESYHLLCHDLGDSICQQMVHAQRKSQQRNWPLKSWALLNGGVFPALHRPTLVQQLLLNSYAGPVVSHIINFRLFALSFLKVFGTAKPTKEIEEHWALIKHNGGNKVSHLHIHYITERAVHKSAWVASLTRSPIPLAFINGPADPVSGRHMYEEFILQVPNAKAFLLGDGVGHYPQLEAPDQVISAYFTFLDGL